MSKFTIVLLLSIFGCTKTNIYQTESFTLWVNAQKVDCMGVGPQKCMQVQKSDTLNPNNWSLKYEEITRFTFEPGSVYKLEVIEKQLDPATVPADASTIETILIKVLEKQPTI